MDSNNNNENQNDLSNRNDEFFARLIRACGHNIILTELYKNITSENPDLNLDLSKSYNAELHDFITSLTGFLSMQNFETISSKLKNDDIDKIVNGNFRLKELTPAEFAAMTKDSKPPKIKNNVERYNLYTIQDGKYHIERKYGKAKLYLTTPTVEYFSKDQTTMSTKDIFHIIRNVVAHNGFYNYDSKLIYFNHDDYIKIPRMWLRGYAELFAKYASTFNTKEAASFLLNELPKTNNTLSSTQEINAALSLIKNYFSPEVLQNYFRVNNFVNYRIKYDPTYNEKTLEQKVEFLIQILDKNPNFLKSNTETINPSIVYNIQQVIGKEINKRDMSAEINSDDPIIQEYANLQVREDELIERAQKLLEASKKDVNKANKILHSQIKIIKEEIDEHKKRSAAIKQEIENRFKFETEHMNLYDAEDLKNLPVESAVNIISLFAYTNLVVSGLYEYVLRNTDFHNLNQEQKDYLYQFKLNNLTYIKNSQEFQKPYNAKTRCYILNSLRNAVCHGLIAYNLPSLNGNNTPNIKDIQVTFYCDYDNSQIIGTIGDFFEFFTDKSFNIVPPEAVVTADLVPLVTDLPEDVPKIKKFTKPKNSGDGSEE